MSVRIAILGASGNVSRHCIQSLQLLLVEAIGLGDRDDVDTSTEFEIVIFSRDSASVLPIQAPNCVCNILSGDITDASSVDAILSSGFHRVYYALPQCLSSKDMLKVSNCIADAAHRHKVQHIVRLSSYGIDTFINSPESMISQGNLGEAHLSAENYLETLGLSFTSIRPTSFTSNFTTYDLPSINAHSEFASPLGSDAVVNWVACEDIGAVAAWALMNVPTEEAEAAVFMKRILNVTGPDCNSLSTRAMSELLSSVVNRSIVYEYMSPPPVEDLQQLWLFLQRGGFNAAHTTVREVTGRSPISFREFLEKLVEKGKLVVYRT